MARFPAAVKNEPGFSRLVAFLPDALNGFCDDSNKLAVFRSFSHLTADEAKRALTGARSYPWIDIKDLRINTSGLEAVGRFDPDLPNRIALGADIARRFQYDHDREDARETVLAVTLHECVHFGRAKKGIPDPNLPEAGVEFERTIWGDHHAPWFDATPTELAVPDNTVFLFPVSGETGRSNHLYGRGVRNGGARDHHGIDIFHRGPGNPPVHAVADGVVIGGHRFRKGPTFRRQVGNYGQMVDLDHGNGLVTRYAHLESVEVNPGQHVLQGDRIGTLGSTGTERGEALEEGRPVPSAAVLPHLHFEVRRADGPPFQNFEATLDPIGFFAFLRDQPENQWVRALQPGDKLKSPARLPELVLLESDHPNDFAAFPNTQFGPLDPRGLRNNNPGNLRRSSDEWKGLCTPDRQLDPAFFQFIEMKWGIRAMARTLINYRRKYRIRTIVAVASRWAPSDDSNHPARYAQTVVTHSQGRVNDVNVEIDLSNQDLLFGVVRGMMVAENGLSRAGRSGADSVDDGTVREGIAQALEMT